MLDTMVPHGARDEGGLQCRQLTFAPLHYGYNKFSDFEQHIPAITALLRIHLTSLLFEVCQIVGNESTTTRTVWKHSTLGMMHSDLLGRWIQTIFTKDALESVDVNESNVS